MSKVLKIAGLVVMGLFSGGLYAAESAGLVIGEERAYLQRGDKIFFHPNCDVLVSLAGREVEVMFDLHKSGLSYLRKMRAFMETGVKDFLEERVGSFLCCHPEKEEKIERALQQSLRKLEQDYFSADAVARADKLEMETRMYGCFCKQVQVFNELLNDVIAIREKKALRISGKS